MLAQARGVTPQGMDISFLALGGQAAAPAQLDALTAPGARTPAELTAWAALCAGKGWREAALRCLRAALAADAEYFPARMALADTLAANRQYSEALAELDRLAAEFPDSSKVQLTRARVLSWDKRYDEAQAAYATLAQADASDPVPMREAARVYFWAKERVEALASYARLLEPSVDARLAAELAKAAQDSADAGLASTAREMAQAAEAGSEYRRYEGLSLGGQAGLPGQAAPKVESVERAVAGLLPAYRIQKGAGLEAEAKNLFFDRRFARSLPVYEELLAFEPGNQEARFDQGQAACALGLCSQERQAYARLLEIDPLNTLAGAAQERLDRRTGPALALRHNVWHEVGRGQLARILRQRTDFGLSASLADDHRLSLTQHRWYESPSGAQSYEALGQTLAWEGVFSSSLRASAAWTNKRYTMGDLDNVDTGRARLEFNPGDAVRLGLGYETLREANPRLIYAGAFGFSQRGPYAARPAYDDLIQGMTGIPWLTQQAGSDRPRYAPMVLVDRMAGLQLCTAITSALVYRARTGCGQRIDVPMFEGMLSVVLGEHLAGRQFEPPRGAAGYQRSLAHDRRPYETRDGWLCVLVYNDKHWRSFLSVIGRPELFEGDPRFSSQNRRLEHIDHVYGFLADVLRTRGTQEWLSLFEQADIPAARMLSLDEILEDEHVRATGFVRRVRHPSEGALRAAAIPTEWSASQPQERLHAPGLGENTVEVLAESGYSPEEIAQLLQCGAARVQTTPGDKP